MSAVTRSQKKMAEQAGLNQEGIEDVSTDADTAGHGAAASRSTNPPPTSIPLTNPGGRVIDHRDPKEPDEQQPSPGQQPPPPPIPSDPVGSVLCDPRGFVPPPRPIELKSTSGSISSRRSQRTALDAQRRQVELEIEMERAKIRMQVLEKQLALRMANIDAAEAAAEEEADERHSEAQAASQHRVEEWLSRTPRVKEGAPRERGQIPRPSATEVRFDETLPHASPHTPKRERSEEHPRKSMEGLEKLADAIVGMSRPRPRQTYELPKFDGNPADWPTFKCMYERSTATYKFEAYENMARLQQALVGAAKSAVEDILRGAGDPSDVMYTLEEEFGHPSAILNYALRKIKALPRVTDSGSELKKFTSVVRNCVSLLRNVKADGYLNNPQLVSELLNKLSTLQRTLYGDFVKNKDSVCSVDLRVSPSLDILLEFLAERSRSASYLVPMDLAAPSVSATQTAPRPRVLPVHRNVQKVATVASAPEASRPAPRTVSSAPVASRPPQVCVLCNENHSLPSCHKFVALDNSEQWNVAKDNKLCFKCLCYRHAREFCRAKRCEQCNAPHHGLLHYTRPAEDSSVPPTSVPETEVKQALSVRGTCTKALLKIVPVSIKRDNCVIQTHALLDDGATVSLMDSSLVTCSDAEPCPLTIVTANGQRVTDSESRRVNIRLCGPNGLEHCVNVRTMAQLNLPSQTIPMEVYKNVHLSDLCDTMDCSEDCKEGGETKPLLLLGQDNWELIVGREIRRGKSGQPIASLTQLGWVIHGQLGNCASTSSDCESVHCAAVVAKSRLNSDLHNLVKMQFELDSIGIAEVERKNVETERANTILERTSRRVEGGWECGLLWKNENPSFPDNHSQALSRLKGIERRMDKDPKFSAAYVAQIDRLLNEGYAEKVPDGWNTEPRWYLPHFGVVNPNKPGKLRLVYDAAASYKAVSLNSNLLSGLVLLNSLFGVLVRFRCGRIAVKADIADMFLRVKIRNEDKGAQLFLWRGQDRDRRPDVYVIISMIFGATSSPSMAIYILNKNARDLADKFPNAVDPIEKKHYVDDYLDSFDDDKIAKTVVNEVTQAHAAGGFHIRGWVSNSPDMCEKVDGTAQVAQNVEFGKGLEQLPIERTLGLIWNPQSDDLSFDLSFKKIPGEIASGEVVPTKRQFLKVIMSVFDPLGFLSPAVIPTKILLQQIWKSDIGWDDKLQDREARAWRRWIENVDKISSVRIPRCYGLDLSRELELHVFGDASELAYAAVAYLVGVNGNGERECSLVAGKTRVAPLKIVSIPRLELQAAVLACRLGNSIRNELGLVVNMYYWTDSQTVLRWIASDARDYQRFVSHRLCEIESKSERGDWRWVASAENPADEATKLGWPRDRSIWFSGPRFLRDPPHLWPKAVTKEVPEANLELRVNVVAQAQLQEPLIDLRRFSSWQRAVRVTARALAFVRKCRGRKTDHLEKEDFRDAETLLLKEAQKEHFSNEIGILRSGKNLPTNSKLRALDPMLYEDGLLRVRGRIGASTELSFDEKHPIIIKALSP